MTYLLSSAVRIAALCWVTTLAVLPVHGQRKREGPPLAEAPPPPIPQSILVRPGQTVNVPLGIHGARGERLEFLIRTNPKAGKLSEVLSTGRNSAMVQYTAGAESGKDRFFYAVRNAEGVSAPAAVEITIIVAPALPPRLIVVEALEFPAVIAGQQSTAQLEVFNQGGGMAEGELTVPEQWRVDGSARYQLAGGKRVTFKLIFAPEKAGDFGGQAVFGPEPRRVVRLSGTAKEPLVATPEALELLTSVATQTRTAHLRLENRTTEERKVKVTAGPRLTVDSEVTVPAEGKIDVVVGAGVDDPSAIEEKVRLESAAWVVEVPVRGAPVPARAKFGMKRLDFGHVKGGESAEATAILENSGGVPADVRLSVDAPFEVRATGVQVPARGSLKVPVQYHAPKDGPFGVTVTALTATSGGVPETLPLSVIVVQGPAPPPRSERSASTVKPPAGEAPAGSDGSPRLPNFNFAQPSTDVPGRLGAYTRDVTATTAVLEWPSTLGPGTALAVHLRQVAMGKDGALVTNWQPLPKAKISESNGMRRAELSELEPSQLHVVRVLSGGESVFTTKFMTPAKKPILDIGWRSVFITLMVVGLLAVLWQRWKHRGRSGW